MVVGMAISVLHTFFAEEKPMSAELPSKMVGSNSFLYNVVVSGLALFYVSQLYSDIYRKGHIFEWVPDSGATAIHIAVKNKEIDLIEKLLREEGEDPNGKDDCNQTPLHYAAKYGIPEVVQPLVDNGADVDATTHLLSTPLHYACSNRHLDVVDLLLKNGADLNRQTDFGTTLLHLAAFRDFVELIEPFLRHGANPFIKDNRNRTARDVAEPKFRQVLDQLRDVQSLSVLAGVRWMDFSYIDCVAEKEDFSDSIRYKLHDAVLRNIMIFLQPKFCCQRKDPVLEKLHLDIVDNL